MRGSAVETAINLPRSWASLLQLGDFETAFLSGLKAPSQRSSPSFFRRLRSFGTAAEKKLCRGLINKA